MKIKIRNAVSLFTCGVLITTQSIAAGVVPGYGAAGSYNLALPITEDPAVLKSVNENAGSVAQGAGPAGASSGLGISTPVMVGAAVVVAAAAAIAIGASSGSGGGSSTPTHASP